MISRVLARRRFIAGNRMRDALIHARKLNSEGLAVTIDILAGKPGGAQQALLNAHEYLDLLDAIKVGKVHANISVKLTTLGLALGGDHCRHNLDIIARHAKRHRTTVIIDMEELQYKDQIIAVYKKVHRKHGNLWITIQAYLPDSIQDLGMLIEEKAGVRIVKGIYKNPGVIRKKLIIDENFMQMESMLLRSRLNYAVGTHDDKIIEFIMHTTKPAARKKMEIQMLYGVKPHLAKQLREKGFKVRIYLPYGKNWLGYVMRRLRESKH